MIGRREAIIGTIGTFGSCLFAKADYNKDIPDEELVITEVRVLSKIKIHHINKDHVSWCVTDGDIDYFNLIGIDRFQKISNFAHNNKNFDRVNVYRCNDKTFKVRFFEGQWPKVKRRTFSV